MPDAATPPDDRPCPEIFIGLGANTGDPLSALAAAREAIADRIGPVCRTSSLYHSEPWGDPLQPWFHNQVLQVNSSMGPEDILLELLDIEKSMGRERGKPNAPRSIDLDLLFYGGITLNTQGLTLPHPRLVLRNFVLIPMMEIAPEFPHPVTGLSMEEHYLQSADTLEVCLIDDV
jgi:2-amino-4-hydroxy-6-hydroxymethyldihydropteridine diphosphokinase